MSKHQSQIQPWPTIPLEKAAAVQKGKKPSSFSTDSDRSLRYLEAAVLRHQREPKHVPRLDLSRLVCAEQLDTLILWDGANAGDIFPGQSGVVASTMARVRVVSPKIIPEFLHCYLLRLSSHLRHTAAGSTVPHVRGKIVAALPVPLPPLPVQERIVEILQKADEIRRKRQEAMEIVDAILPAMYRDVFGDPRSNPRGWPMDVLGNYLVDTRYGTSARTSGHGTGDPVLRIPNVIQRTIDTADLKYLQVSDKERQRLLLKPGDILVVRTNGNKDYVGRCAVFDLDDEYLFASYLIRLRLDVTKLNPHYVVAYLATSLGRQEVDLNSRTSAGQYNISSAGLKAIRIPIPPLKFQQKFLGQYEQWKVSKARLEASLQDAEVTLACLIVRAFSGELTAEWEKANAGEIEKLAAFHERLPRLLVLALLAEKARRAGRKAAEVLVTALMKYAFLFQMEANGRRRLYQFVPYHYGPFAKELYSDLEKLQADGLVTVENDAGEEKTRIALADPAKAETILSELPEDLKEDAATIIDTYGDLNHNALLKTVYDKYPAYAKKSRLRRKAAKKAKQRRAAK